MRVWTCFFPVLTQFLLWSSSAKVNRPIDSLATETSKWSVLTYTERYVDEENEQVVYHGTLFLQLSGVSLSSCDLKLALRVQDKFSGTTIKPRILSVKRTEIGPKTETFNYTYLLRLNDPVQIDATVLRGRPMQIRAHTGYVCDEDSSCSIPWLHVKVPEASIKETRESDGVTDFNEMVKEIDIPMSSRQAAQESATQLKALAAECSSGTGHQ